MRATVRRTASTLPNTRRAPRYADQFTGGLLLISRTASSCAALTSAFMKPGCVSKTYLALVAGRLEGEGKYHATPLTLFLASPRWVEEAA